MDRELTAVTAQTTNLTMEGLDFKSYSEEISALNSVGLVSEANLLASINEKSTDEDLAKCYPQLALNNDYDAFWNTVYIYAGKHLSK